MRERRFWILPLLLAISLLPVACDKGDSSEATGGSEQQVREPRREAPEQAAAVCDGVCFTPLPSVGTNPRVAPHSLRYEDYDYLKIRNVTEQRASFDGWFLSTGDATVPLPQGITVAPMGTFTFHLGEAGTNDAANVYLADPGLSLDAAGEVALFSGEDLTSPENIKLYMRWGAAPEGTTHIEAAHQAELWHRDAFIPVCDEYVGIVAMGNISIPRGFKSQSWECFERLE